MCVSLKNSYIRHLYSTLGCVLDGRKEIHIHHRYMRVSIKPSMDIIGAEQNMVEFNEKSNPTTCYTTSHNDSHNPKSIHIARGIT